MLLTLLVCVILIYGDSEGKELPAVEFFDCCVLADVSDKFQFEHIAVFFDYILYDFCMPS